jgi:hypothetical protein
MRRRPGSQPTFLPLGRDALAWVRLGGTPARGRWMHSVAQRWQSFWFERNLALQRMSPPPPARALDPVFILGLWRSGTTYLHSLLGTCPGMYSPTTFQCMNSSAFRLVPAPKEGKSISRPMDGMTIATSSPQEDEFALLALGVPSTYLGFIDPRRLPELARWLDPGSWTQAGIRGWPERWTEFLAGVCDGRPGRVVLKSPGHTFRIGVLAPMFPGASHVWLTRDPTDVFLSNRKMWRAMVERYSLWDFEPAVLDSFLTVALERAAECLVVATAILGREKLAVIGFEQLTGAPVDSLEKLNRRLGLGEWGAMHSAIATAAAAGEGHRAAGYDRRDLPDAAAAAAETLRQVQARAISSHGI